MTTATKIDTREEWLTRVADEFAWPLIEKAGGIKPAKWRVSVGFPVGKRISKTATAPIQHVVGQAHHAKQSADGSFEIFISPVLEAGAVAAVLIHELIHTTQAWKDGHHGEFKRIARAVGLAGKMRSTVAGEQLAMDIADFLIDFPPYPHAALKLAEAIDPKTGKPRKAPGSRLLKVMCSECGYTLRTTRQWLDHGVPACPNDECDRHGHEMEEA